MLSSLRSEAVKGYVTRVGTRIVKGVSRRKAQSLSDIKGYCDFVSIKLTRGKDIAIKLSSLPPPKGFSAYRLHIIPATSDCARPSPSPSPPSDPERAAVATPSTDRGERPPPLIVSQLVSARAQVDAARDVVDAARWAGDVRDPSFIAGQLRLLQDCLHDGWAALKGGEQQQQLMLLQLHAGRRRRRGRGGAAAAILGRNGTGVGGSRSRSGGDGDGDGDDSGTGGDNMAADAKSKENGESHAEESAAHAQAAAVEERWCSSDELVDENVLSPPLQM